MQYKVQYRAPGSVPLPRVEPGMVLARAVRNDKGQLLIGKDNEITEKNLGKLRQFGVNRVMVEKDQERWLDEEEVNQLTGEYEVVDTRENPEAESVEEDIDSLEAWRRQIQDVESKARSRGLEGAEELRKQIGRLLKIEDSTDELTSRLEQRIDDGDNLDFLEQLLTELGPVLDDRVREMDVDGELLMDVIETVREKESVRDQGRLSLQEMVGDQPDEISPGEIDGSDETSTDPVEAIHEILEKQRGNDDGADTVDRSLDLLEDCKQIQLDERELVKSIHESVEKPRLQAQLLDVLEGKAPPESINPDEELEHRLMERIQRHRNQKNDLFKEIETILPEQEAESVRETLETHSHDTVNTPDLSLSDVEVDPPSEKGGPLESVESLLDQLSGELDGDAGRGHLEAHKQRIESLKEQKASLESLLGESETSTSLIDRLLDPRESIASNEIFDDGIDENLLDDIQDFYGELRRALEGLNEDWSAMFDDQIETPTLSDQHGEGNPASTVLAGIENIDLFSRNGGNKAKDVVDDKRREEKIEEAIEQRDIPTLSRLTDLPESVIESAFRFYRVPEPLSGTRERILEHTQQLLWDILFHQSLDRDRFKTIQSTINDLLDRHDRTIKYLISPPEPEEYLLPHCFHTMLFITLMGRDHGESRGQRSHLLLAALTRDIGLCALPEPMALKTMDSSPRVRREISKHPLYSARVLERTDGVDPAVVQLVKEHHERADGSGYPRGTTPSEWADGAGRLQIAGRYASLLEERTNHPKNNPREAMVWLEDHSDYWEDRALSQLRKSLGHFPNGSILMLSDGRMALVRDQNPDSPEKPRLYVLTDHDRNRLNSPDPLDLTRQSSLCVKKLLKSA
jgi:HD-GYP domain-containing protein (c-di-GMP phosphodiesterase class II)